MTPTMITTVATGDAATACTIQGEGPPLLLVHGAEASRHMFDAIAPLLARRFTVIAYDQRDCGETEAPPVPATLEQLADDARDLLAALGHARAHVFGSSFGGRVAQVLAVRHPHCVDRLVLGSTWALPQALATAYPEGSRRIAALRAGLPHSAHELAGMFFPPACLAERPALRDWFAAVQPESERSTRRAATVADRPDIPPSAIQAPTLLIAGDSDQVVPARLTFALAGLIPHSRTALLAGVGHATCIQAPAEVAQALIHFIDAPAA
ncbi:alpha/beta hydrolase [Variovorax sp. J31P207]|uniref:alpha/beta fold hydrolase n=1 Tax=Variovorax sp. J31P207 TaxID=3053510 RepID=UPI002574A63E|nr:alpha/beta hydrolase [Variovorax sp. J31P207]MDM0066874.1 alpha/beta hydrolase [Variovorax sp. J31P207]